MRLDPDGNAQIHKKGTAGNSEQKPHASVRWRRPRRKDEASLEHSERFLENPEVKWLEHDDGRPPDFGFPVHLLKRPKVNTKARWQLTILQGRQKALAY